MESIAPIGVELDTVMSNFDHQIDLTIGEQLKKGGCFSRYAGWNFSGIVWWDAETNEYVCEVWRYHVPVALYRGTLENIMYDVSSEYGNG